MARRPTRREQRDREHQELQASIAMQALRSALRAIRQVDGGPARLAGDYATRALHELEGAFPNDKFTPKKEPADAG